MDNITGEFGDVEEMVCSGTCLISLQFSCGSGSKVYTWNFQLAPVSVLLLGADFLKHFNLLVNVKGRKVVHADCPEMSLSELHQVLSLRSSLYLFSQLRSRSRNSWKSIKTSSPLTGLQPQNLVTGSNTTS